MLRFKSDRRTVLLIAITTGFFIANWLSPKLNWYYYIGSLFMAMSVTSMVHNHNHVSVFKSRILNFIYEQWLTIFYGYPVFAWKPTHNQNHHVYGNREGDMAPSYMVGEGNNLLTLIRYPMASGSVQQKINIKFIKGLWKTNRKRFYYYISQFVSLALFIGAAFLINWKKALLYVIIPQQVALNIVLVFNYIQHVHCDEESRWDHSRNITGPVMNYLLLNNGFHTVHHENPRLHWSESRAAHYKVAHKMDPRVNEPSYVWYMFRTYILGIFFKSARTENMRAERQERERQAKNSQPIEQPSSPSVAA